MSTSSPPANPALIPLLTTTATLSFAVFETIFFRSHLKSAASDSSKHRHEVARALSLWWHNSLPSTLTLIISLTTASLVSGVRTYRAFVPKIESTRRYVALGGTLLAIAHLAFAPKIARLVQDMAYAYERVGDWRAGGKGSDVEERGMTEEQVADDAVLEGQREWLRVHLWRILIADLPAWGCFAWLAFGRK